MPSWLKHLYIQVLIAVAAGITLGAVNPEFGIAAKPLADIFIGIIKILVTPIVFTTVVIGIGGMRDMKTAGRVGLKALIYFEVMTTLALLIGLFIAHIFQPGSGMHIDPATLDAGAISAYADKSQSMFTRGYMLPLLAASIACGIGLLTAGDRSDTLLGHIRNASDLLFKIMGWVIKFAPLGAFGAMAFAVGKYGVEILSSLASLMAIFYLTCIAFICLALGSVMKLCGLKLWPFIKYIKDEIILVLGTSSSETALPRMMDKLTRLGCKRHVVDMVIPTGYSFNLDGTCIYLTLAALFIAYALDIPMTLGDEIMLIAVLLLTSKGAAAVTGGGFIVLAATLPVAGNIPVAGLALILGIDRFMSEARAITNLIGNGVATIAVATWERAVDKEKATSVLQ